MDLNLDEIDLNLDEIDWNLDEIDLNLDKMDLNLDQIDFVPVLHEIRLTGTPLISLILFSHYNHRMVNIYGIKRIEP